MQSQQEIQNSLFTYYHERMMALGITDEINKVKLWYHNADTQANELREEPVFRENERGIDILVFSLSRHKKNYANEGGRWKNREYKVTRLKEPIVKPNGDTIKYVMPKGQPTHPFFPPGLIDKYDQAAAIPVLYITEGYFKAFKAQMHGIDCVGLPSITCMKNKETGKLHDDIFELIKKCQVQRIVWLTDGDCRNITSKEISEGIDLAKRPNQFFQTVAAFYDLLSGVEANKYFAHINSDNLTGSPKGLDDLLCAFPDDIEAIKDEFSSFDTVKKDTFNGKYLVKIDITYTTGKARRYFMLHDVDQFYLFHVDRREDLKGKDFKWFGTLYSYDESQGKCNVKVPADASKYFRAGDKYYEFVMVPNKYNELNRRFVRREKQTIIDDYGKKILDHIPKYKEFCNVPDHMNYQPVINYCYNTYAPFEHEMHEGECEATIEFIKHIFGEDLVPYTDDSGAKVTIPRWELGLDYITLLFKKPQQVLPILCLVSEERQTGKTTFSKWLKMIFTENMAIVGNEDLANPFNAHWGTKLLICCDETKIDKHVVLEKVKSLSTSDHIMINAKGRDQVEMGFFGKFIFNSNNEDNFISLDEAEIRFWVIRVPSIKIRNVELLQDLKDEIPAFLYYINKRDIWAKNRERHWFETSLLITDAQKKLVANSKPNVEKQIRMGLTQLFELSALDTIKFPLDAIVKELLRNRFEAEYVRRTLHKMGYKTGEGQRSTYPRVKEELEGDGGTIVRVIPIKYNGRFYEFNREDFTDMANPKDELIDIIQPVSSMPAGKVTTGDLPF